MNINKEIEISISDAIIEKPIRFSVGILLVFTHLHWAGCRSLRISTLP